MAKGNLAKENLTKVIVEALGDNFITIADKKIYAWADDGGERVQIALSMTMPKVQMEANAAATTSANTENKTTTSTPTTLSPEDKAQVEKLKRRLIDAGVYQE